MYHWHFWEVFWTTGFFIYILTVLIKINHASRKTSYFYMILWHKTLTKICYNYRNKKKMFHLAFYYFFFYNLNHPNHVRPKFSFNGSHFFIFFFYNTLIFKIVIDRKLAKKALTKQNSKHFFGYLILYMCQTGVRSVIFSIK